VCHAGSIEHGAEEVLFELLVIVLDERADDRGAVPHGVGRQILLGARPDTHFN
jgi:hypothetical protein